MNSVFREFSASSSFQNPHKWTSLGPSIGLWTTLRLQAMSIMEPYTLKPVEHTPDIERREGELALVFPDFDDPNFDSEEAIAGILGVG